MTLPSLAYLRALSSRLMTASSSARSSKRALGRLGSMCRSTVDPTRARRGSGTRRPRAPPPRPTSPSRTRKPILPRSTLAKSSTFSISAVSRSLSLTMICRYSRRFSSLATRPVSSSSPNMRTSESGVFSSCDTLATKSLFNAESRRSLLGGHDHDAHTGEDDRAGEPDHDHLEQAAALHACAELLRRGERHLQTPVVERGGEGAADGEVAAAEGRAEDDATIFVDHVHAAAEPGASRNSRGSTSCTMRGTSCHATPGSGRLALVRCQ